MLKRDDGDSKRDQMLCAGRVVQGVEISGKGLNGTWGSTTYLNLSIRQDRQPPGLRTAELPASVWDGKVATKFPGRPGATSGSSSLVGGRQGVEGRRAR
jgi:hypothetical protein